MSINEALEKCEYCFKFIKNKYFKSGGDIIFNPFNSMQNTVFLYQLSNILYKRYQNNTLADRVYYLNKIMNCIDLYYELELPNIIYFQHAVGTFIGRAKIGDFLVIHQNCTIGANKNKYPIIGKNVTLYPYACILGNCKIGDNVVISANTYIKDCDIPDNSIVYGQSPNLVIKNNKKIDEISLHWL